MKYKMQALADNEKVPSLFIQKRRTKEITFFQGKTILNAFKKFIRQVGGL